MNEDKLRTKLPIGQNEKILKVIRHHWFAYASVYAAAGALCLFILAGIIFASVSQSSLGISDKVVMGVVLAGVILMAIIVGFSFIPIWIKKQEILVLTEEALLQLTKPSLFANNVSQINLQHVVDVTVRQNTLGTMFGFGGLYIETPGEQSNYEFSIVGDPKNAAKTIIEAHENYAAALESGQIQTTLGERAPTPGAAWRPAPPQWPAANAAPAPSGAPAPETGAPLPPNESPEEIPVSPPITQEEPVSLPPVQAIPPAPEAPSTPVPAQEEPNESFSNSPSFEEPPQEPLQESNEQPVDPGEFKDY